jgi:hypothetical protein
LTPFLKKCSILAELWTDYRDHEDLEDFLEYNDMGLPLAYFLATDVVDVTPKAEVYVDETWYLLLACFDLEDTGFESLDQIITLQEGEEQA